jgi:hypothetical protein
VPCVLRDEQLCSCDRTHYCQRFRTWRVCSAWKQLSLCPSWLWRKGGVLRLPCIPLLPVNTHFSMPPMLCCIITDAELLHHIIPVAVQAGSQ